MRDKIGTIGLSLSRAVVFLRVRWVDTLVDQACDDAENERVFGQLMSESVHQVLKFVQLRHRMFEHNAV